MPRQNPFLSLDQQIAGDAYTSTEPMDNLIILCDDFGSRFGGTDGERKAADFFMDTLTQYRLTNVHQEPIQYLGWTRGQVNLEIIQPIQKTIRCITLPHSPPATVEGGIVDVGDGAPGAFDQRAGEIKGSFVMTNSVPTPSGSSRRIHRSEKYGRAVMAGAIGFIFVNRNPSYGPVTGGIGRALSLSARGNMDGPGHIPGISISFEDAAFVRRVARRKGSVKVRLTSSDTCEPMTSWNIIGDLPGQRHPEQIVMMGSHYDGHDISQGAADPASGAVSVLEAARLLGKYAQGLPLTVRFALWGIEEIGLFGSRAYVRSHEDELDQIRFYLNMDAAGSKANNRDIIVNEWPDLQPYLERWSQEMALGYAVGQSVLAFSDHFPFFMAGVPTGGIQSVERKMTGDQSGHTRWDTVDKVDLKSLREASTLAARLAARIASEQDWPAARRTAETVAGLLDRPEYREEQEFRQRLDAFYEAAEEG